jgi:hypothetical protein
MHNDLFIKNDFNENSNKNETFRRSSTFKLNFNEDENSNFNIKIKSDYIYSILYNPIYFGKLSNNEKKEFLMR